MVFEYKGEIDRPYIDAPGPVLEIKIPTQRDGKVSYPPPNGTGWTPGDTLETDDSRSIRVLQADPRFEEQ